MKARYLIPLILLLTNVTTAFAMQQIYTKSYVGIAGASIAFSGQVTVTGVDLVVLENGHWGLQVILRNDSQNELNPTVEAIVGRTSLGTQTVSLPAGGTNVVTFDMGTGELDGQVTATVRVT